VAPTIDPLACPLAALKLDDDTPRRGRKGQQFCRAAIGRRNRAIDRPLIDGWSVAPVRTRPARLTPAIDGL
jgi:hypothetical protein